MKPLGPPTLHCCVATGALEPGKALVEGLAVGRPPDAESLSGLL